MDSSPDHVDFLRSPGPIHQRRRWCRVVASRVAQALRGADPGDVLAAGALAVALVEQEPDDLAAARRGAALLDAVLIVLDGGVDPEVRRMLDAAAEAFHQLPRSTPAAVAQRLGGVLREVAARAIPAASHRSLEGQVPSYVAEHLHEGVRLADLARRLGYSPSHCSTLVRRTTGERFSALRRRMQLERAIGLLRSGTSVKEAALAAGFSEPAYFSRVFARRFGVPPSRWRDVLA